MSEKSEVVEPKCIYVSATLQKVGGRWDCRAGVESSSVDVHVGHLLIACQLLSSLAQKCVEDRGGEYEDKGMLEILNLTSSILQDKPISGVLVCKAAGREVVDEKEA
jgi:hypothetical protein